MRHSAVVLVLILLLLAVPAGWQLTASHLANSELLSDMKDLAVQNAFRTGLAPLETPEELRDSVIKSARTHGIPLQPQQVVVHRTVTPDMLSISLAADYEARVSLLLYSFTLHFSPSSSHSGTVVVK